MVDKLSNPSVAIGDKTSHKWIFHQSDFNQFAKLSGDDNPIHIDPSYAAQTRFQKTICHGMLIYGVISALVKDQYPHYHQEAHQISFLSPVYADEEILIKIEVIALPTPSSIKLIAVVAKSDETIACNCELLLKREN